MSDGGPSSIKRLSQCAARVPALSRGYEDRVELKFDYAVYGLVSCIRHFFDRHLLVKPKKPKRQKIKQRSI